MRYLEIPLGKRSRFYRTFEMLPAMVSYLVILLPIILSLIDPLVGAIFVIVFIIVWFVKSMVMSVRSIQGYNTLQIAQSINWADRLKDLEHPKKVLKAWRGRVGWRINVHKHNLDRMILMPQRKKPSDIYHAIIIPTYQDGREVLEPTVKSILDSNYDKKHVILVITVEERGGPEVARDVEYIKEKYGEYFDRFYIMIHPKDIPNEVVGKGANITYAGKILWQDLKKDKFDPENVIVTILDSDNRPHREYLSYVTYEYIVHPDRRHVSLQPLSLFLNNIWDVPAPMRVLATSNSFWNIIISQRPHVLRNFAAHSQGLASLVDTNFWSTRTVVEDGHQYWRSYFRYDGHYDVVPIYVPIYQDVVMSDKYIRTLKAQFVQLRRWAYGASDIPYVAERVFTKKRTAPFWDAFLKFMRLFDSHVSWASAPFILLLGAFAPLILSSGGASRNIVAYQLPSIASGIQQLAMIGIFVTIVLSFRMLPPKPKRYRWTRYISMLTQWVLAPVLGIVYSASAALYSQTRLLVGNYMDSFDVTEKSVLKDKS